METTRLSSKGQVIIPKSLRAAQHWDPGLELVAIPMGDGVLLKPKAPFAATTLDEVAGCLPHTAAPKTEDDIEAALAKGIRSQWRDSN